MKGYLHANVCYVVEKGVDGCERIAVDDVPEEIMDKMKEYIFKDRFTYKDIDRTIREKFGAEPENIIVSDEVIVTLPDGKTVSIPWEEVLEGEREYDVVCVKTADDFYFYFDDDDEVAVDPSEAESLLCGFYWSTEEMGEKDEYFVGTGKNKWNEIKEILKKLRDEGKVAFVLVEFE